MRRMAGAATVLMAVWLSVGCSPSAQDQARVVSDDQVPFGLLEPADRAPPPRQDDRTVTTTIFLVDNPGMLVAVPRPVARLNDRSLLEQLAAEPNEAELARGLRSLLSSDGDRPLVLDVDRRRGVATIDLDQTFVHLDGEEQLLALAQLVLTFTAQPGVGQVAFTLEGAPIDIPRADGTTTGDPVTRDDFVALVAA